MFDMDTVTLSSKFQVVIPERVRRTLGLAAGEKLRVFAYGNRVELVPVKSIKALRGFARGLDTTIDREPDRL